MTVFDKLRSPPYNDKVDAVSVNPLQLSDITLTKFTEDRCRKKKKKLVAQNEINALESSS